MPDHYRRVDGFECVMPGCGRRFGSRRLPAFPVCPECQAAARRHADAQKKARKRLALRQAPRHA
jgi:hypothetical protein